MALSRDVVIRMLGDVKDADRALKAAADAADVSAAAYRRAEREQARQTAAMEAASRKQRAAMEDLGRGATVMGAALVAGLGMAAKAAIDWESAWTGVLKTVDGTEAQLAGLERGLRGLARTLPATHQEIAGVAEAAGQLGIAREDIVQFTRTMIDLGETTNLTAEDAATAIAQMMNVMQTAPEDVDRLASTLVALGNDGASTERQIIEMAQRISGAAAVVGLAEGEVLALANTVASMGIEVEAGGSSVSRVLTDMSKAAQTGSAELGIFAETAGMSAEEFARAFREDPAEAFATFIEGLGAMQQAGENVFGVLDELGLSDVRVSQALLGMASAGDLLRNSLDLQATAWEDNTALAEEAGKRYDTTAAQLEIARNSIVEAGIEIGEALLPVLASLAEGVAGLAQWFAHLPDPIKAVVSGLGSVAGVAGLAGGAFLLLFPRVMDTVQSFRDLRQTAPGVADGLGKVGKAAGIVAAIAAAAYAVDELTKSFQDAPPSMEETTTALLNMGSSMEDIDSQFSSLGSSIEDIDGLRGAAERLADPSLINNLDAFFAEVQSFGGAEGDATRTRIIEQLNRIGESLGFMVESGHADRAKEQFQLLADEWERGGGTVEDLRSFMPAYQEALAGVANEQKLAGESAQGMADATANIAPSISSTYASLAGYAASLGMSEEATQELITKAHELGATMAAFVDPLGTYTGYLDEKIAAEQEAAGQTESTGQRGQEAWRQFVNGASIAFDEYLAELEQQVVDQQNWQTNMLILAGRVSQGTLDELARMGPEGAPLVADLVSRSDAELARFETVTAARSQAATDAWGEQLALAAPVLAQVAGIAGQGVVNELAAKLAAGTTTVAAIARQYGIELAEGVNPVLQALGRGRIRVGTGPTAGTFIEADGGVLSFYANGGMEHHVAQIAPAGAWRVWAEPETGGEAYIPLAASKRSRSRAVAAETVSRLGGSVDWFADGGFTSVDQVPRPRSTAPYGPPISTAAHATMQKAYGDTVEWLKANLTPPAPALTGGIGYQAMMAALRSVFPGLALISGYRPNSITATGNKSYHGAGRAVDVPPRSDVFEWIYANYFAQTRELIFSPKGNRQIWNGRHHMYSEPTRGDHWDHVHWAMANGGVIREPIFGFGMRTGATYGFGERGPETVTPGLPAGGGARDVYVEAHIHIGNQTIREVVRVEASAIAAADRDRQGITARRWQ